MVDTRKNSKNGAGPDWVSPVEDRPSVGSVKPEDYPAQDRALANVVTDRGRRAGTGSGSASGSGSAAGGGGGAEDYDLDPVGGGGTNHMPKRRQAKRRGADAPVGGSA